MASASGLSEHHRSVARSTVVEGCRLLLAHAGEVHYSQGPNRWEGINGKLLISHGQYPHHGDCSSTATWLLWNALHHAFSVRDVVNGTDWRAGYTGTIATHGKRVAHDANIKVGDLVLYGSGWPFEHVAVALGGGKVFSHGGEAGPFKLAIDYRGDRQQVRRFI